MAFAFEKLRVYQKALDFADQIAALTEGFPRGYGFLADQLNRAALSIAANTAESNGRFASEESCNATGPIAHDRRLRHVGAPLRWNRPP